MLAMVEGKKENFLFEISIGSAELLPNRLDLSQHSLILFEIWRLRWNCLGVILPGSSSTLSRFPPSWFCESALVQ
jgi:hypothetical protein